MGPLGINENVAGNGGALLPILSECEPLIIELDYFAARGQRFRNERPSSDPKFVILVRESKRVDRGSLVGHRGMSTIGTQAADALDIVNEFVLGALLPTEHRPPLRLRLSAVKFQKLRNEFSKWLLLFGCLAEQTGGHLLPPRLILGEFREHELDQIARQYRRHTNGWLG